MVLKILFIDDDPFIRELMEGMLSIDGHTVELTDEGQAGIAAFRAAKGRGEPFDVVITDWAMPWGQNTHPYYYVTMDRHD